MKAPRGARCQTRPYNNEAGLGSLAPKEPNAEIQLTSIVAATRNYGCTIECCGVLQDGHADADLSNTLSNADSDHCLVMSLIGPRPKLLTALDVSGHWG